MRCFCSLKANAMVPPETDSRCSEVRLAPGAGPRLNDVFVKGVFAKDGMASTNEGDLASLACCCDARNAAALIPVGVGSANVDEEDLASLDPAGKIFCNAPDSMDVMPQLHLVALVPSRVLRSFILSRMLPAGNILSRVGVALPTCMDPPCTEASSSPSSEVDSRLR